MPSRWTDDHDRRLCELWATAMTRAEIARQLGFSAPYVSRRAESLGLPPRGGPPSAEASHLFEAVAKRGITIAVLREKLIHTIAADHMVDAVLDDA
jgi:hypothetical protein